MNKLILISVIFFSLKISSQDNCPRLQPDVSESCLKNHNELEDYVINRISLDRTLPVGPLIIGSYTTLAHWHWQPLGCEHHFVVKYDRMKVLDQVGTWDRYEETEPVFRYFHFNESGVLMNPPEILYGKETPINWKSKNKIKSMDSHIEPSYRCELKFEWEWETAKDIKENCPKSFTAPMMASLVLPRKKFPFCEYHVFGMYHQNEDPSSDYEFVHYVYNENGFDLGFFGIDYPNRFKGRVIEISKSPPQPKNH